MKKLGGLISMNFLERILRRKTPNKQANPVEDDLRDNVSDNLLVFSLHLRHFYNERGEVYKYCKLFSESSDKEVRMQNSVSAMIHLDAARLQYDALVDGRLPEDKFGLPIKGLKQEIISMQNAMENAGIDLKFIYPNIFVSENMLRNFK